MRTTNYDKIKYLFIYSFFFQTLFTRFYFIPTCLASIYFYALFKSFLSNHLDNNILSVCLSGSLSRANSVNTIILKLTKSYKEKYKHKTHMLLCHCYKNTKLYFVVFKINLILLEKKKSSIMTMTTVLNYSKI